MERYQISVVKCEIGSILIYTTSNVCNRIEFSDEILSNTTNNIFVQQINEYLEGKRQILDFPVSYSSGLVFTKIWNYLRENVKYGTIITYGELAKACGTNPRIVGYAMASNPLPLYIPCHRVVSKNGIGGFSGGKIENSIKWKKYLLSLEGFF